MSARKAALLLGAALAAAAFLHFGVGSHLTLEGLKTNRVRLEELRAAHAALVAAAFILLYVAQTALSLPGAAVLSIGAGALFGIGPGTLYVVCGATAGAVLAFLLARTLLRERVVRTFGARMAAIDRGLEENGLSYLLFLRLVPLFPFFLVNLACGVTGLRLGTFVLGTLVGIVPGSLVYVNAGASLAAIRTVREVAGPRVLASLALLGLFALLPVVVKAIRARGGSGPL